MHLKLDRIKKFQLFLSYPVLIKKKENLLYLTGRSFMQGYLLVKPAKYPLPASPYFKGRGKSVPPLNVRGGQGVIFLGDGLERIDGVKSDFLKNVGKYIKPRQTLEVFGEFTYAEVKYIKFKNPKLKVKVIVKREPVDYQRAIKEPREILYVKKSMQIVEKVFGLVRKEIKKPGMTEIKLANFIKSTGLKMGAQDISFPPIVASGVNAAIPHHVPSPKRLKAGESIILDFGFKYKNYCSDFTRTVFLKKVPPKLGMVYNQVEKAYIECMSLRANRRLAVSAAILNKKRLLRRQTPRNDRPITGNDLYQKSVSVLAEKHLDKYFIHSLGHGTGLEIHELPNLSPKSKDILQNGMVFSIEPGVYIPRLGGVRIEDLVYLKGDEVNKFINVSTKLKDNIL